MKALVGLAIILGAGHVLLIGAAVAEGALLHWLFPALDLSVWVLVSLGATLAPFYFLFEFIKSAFRLPLDGMMEEDQAEEDEEEDYGEPAGFYVPLPPLTPRRRGRKKRR